MNEEKKVTCFTTEELALKAISRPPEYQQDVLAHATVSDNQICMPIDKFRELRAKWSAYDYEQKYGARDPKWLPVEFENGTTVKLDIALNAEGKPVIRRIARNQRSNHGARPELVPMEARPPEEQAQIKDLLKIVSAFFNKNVPCPFGGACEELRAQYFAEFEKAGGEENCKGCTLSGLQRRYISLIEKHLKEQFSLLQYLIVITMRNMATNHEKAQRICERLFSEYDACLDLTPFLRSRKWHYFRMRDDDSVCIRSLRERIEQEVLAYL